MNRRLQAFLQSTTREEIIVSRHPASVEFIKEKTGKDLPVLSSAIEADVAGKIVYGNLPLHLASLANTVVAVEFTGVAPRGQEYSVEDMRQAGAHLVAYQVQRR
jgi:hypothetical protein